MLQIFHNMHIKYYKSIERSMYKTESIPYQPFKNEYTNTKNSYK